MKPYPIIMMILLATWITAPDGIAQQPAREASPTTAEPRLILMEYRVPPHIFQDKDNPKTDRATNPGGRPCNGVEFKGGRFALYSPAMGTLTVKATPEEHEKIRKEIIRISQSAAPKTPTKK